MHTHFLTTTIISLFYCWEKMFILMIVWVIKKHSMKHYYLKKNIFCKYHADYVFAKRVYKDFAIKNLGEHYDLYVQGGTLLLADVF